MATYGSTNLGINLKSNPATIAAGAYVTNGVGPVGVFGTTGTAWSVVNLGTINAQDAIYLQQGGNITNGVGGVIEAASLGVVIAGAAGDVTNAGKISAVVELRAGGAVANQQGDLIEGSLDGVAISGGYGAVSNGGTIAGTGTGSAGVYLSGGGYMLNAQNALTSGVAQGIAVGKTIGTIVNHGAVTATAAGGIGVNLTGGGSVFNGSSGAYGAQIAAANLGVAISGAAGTVLNYATISATDPKGVGVYLTAGGYLINTASGLIEGGEQAVKIVGGNATVFDYGTIIGGYGLVVEPGTAGQATVVVGGTIIGTTTVVSAGRTFQEAIQLVNGTDLLVLDPSALIVGNINGGGLATLELASGSGTGSLASFGTMVLGFGNVAVDAGVSWRLAGDAGSVLFTNDGTIVITSGDALALGSVGEDAGARGIIDVGGTATFEGTVAKGQRVVFTDKRASLVLDDAHGFVAKIEHFKVGDTIDITGEKVTGSFANGTLTLANTKGKTAGALQFVGHYTASQFALGSDGHGGTVITLGAPAATADAAFGAASGDDRLSWVAAPPASWWTMRG